MNKIFISLFLVCTLFCNQSHALEAPKYFIGIDISIEPYKTKDVTVIKKLGLSKGSKKYLNIEKEISELFKKYVVKDKPFYDCLSDITKEHRSYVLNSAKSSKDVPILYKEIGASYNTWFRQEYGDGVCVFGLLINIKTDTFPVLYTIKTNYTVNDIFGTRSTLTEDIGYATPDNIDKELISASRSIFMESSGLLELLDMFKKKEEKGKILPTP